MLLPAGVLSIPKMNRTQAQMEKKRVGGQRKEETEKEERR